MRFTFMPTQAHVVTTDLSLEEVHEAIEKMINALATKGSFSGILDASYLGTGKVFRIDQEVVVLKNRVSVVAYGELKCSNGVTTITVQYNSYSTVVNMLLWLSTIAGLFSSLCTVVLLLKSHLPLRAWLASLLPLVFS